MIALAYGHNISSGHEGLTVSIGRMIVLVLLYICPALYMCAAPVTGSLLGSSYCCHGLS